jgi:translation initiation factor IF-2
MTQGGKPKKLFKVAKEFNVSTQTIVEALEENGYKIDSKPNANISPEMYSALESVYGVDKAKSKEHERAREEYEVRKTELRHNRNESVTLDNVLEPLDDLPLEPEDEAKVEDESKENKAAAEKEQSEAKKKAEKKEKKTKAEAAEKAEAKKKAEAEAEKKEAKAKEEKQKAEAKKKAEEAKQKAAVEKAEKEKKAEAEKKEAKAKKKKQGKTDDEGKEVTKEAAKKQEEEQEQAEKKKAKEKETQKKTGKKETAEAAEKAEIDNEVTGDEKEVNVEAEEEDEENVIRAKTSKLRGTRVIGSIDITKDKKSSKKKKKKKSDKKSKDESEEETDKKKTRKRKKKRLKRNKNKTEDNKQADTSKNKKKKRNKRGKRVDEEEVEQKMKETMQMLKSSGSVGKKRQKRRRQKREEMAAEREQEAAQKEEQKAILEVTEFITVGDLADLLDAKSTDIITICMNLGIMVSINQRLDASTIELIAEEFGREVHFVDADELLEEIEDEEDSDEDLEPRAPVVTVMGHVDHGKTSLLDYIRKAHVVAGEAGGITQHIGAYEVAVGQNDKKITFLDTPGHEAFTAMRARGAQVTDIVILVVAADDAVMPQTIEAINHAQAAGVSIVVAINKIDKPDANSDKIRQQLSEHNVLVEEWGGKYQSAEISAKTGLGVEELLDKVLIEAELLELKANPDRNAVGIVLESRVDKGKGVVANVLIQKGTLQVGDPFVAGQYFGRVRAMENELGKRIETAGPSTPVQLIGFDGLPQAGDKLTSTEDEKKAREVAQQRQQIRREQDLRKVKHITLDDLSRRMALGEVAELNIIIKGDVDGSIEALSGSLQKISNDEVKVNIIHTGVGAITESDVLLASASDAIIIGFQVRPSAQARKLAEKEQIDIRLFSVIYDAVDAVHDALEGLLSPEINEKVVSTLEVRDTFKVPGAGMVAGCYVTEGKITRNTKVRLIREGIVIYDGEIGSLKRFKDDVREVASGYECGLSIANYNDIKVGDVIEGYEVVETKRKLMS